MPRPGPRSSALDAPVHHRGVLGGRGVDAHRRQHLGHRLGGGGLVGRVHEGERLAVRDPGPEGPDGVEPDARVDRIAAAPPAAAQRHHGHAERARILRGEIPAKKIHEDDHVLAFHDIAPQAPVHVLVIPKGRYVSIADFSAQASAEEITGFWRAVGQVAKALGLEADGYRVLMNMGMHAGQEVPHFHVHICGGRPLGRMISQA
ncbi:MAG: histidine triad nucleotide-binding protein [Roseomonas sp.]|nr:histidine triad nucleotide-binding protein [Roseomonas sp.]